MGSCSSMKVHQFTRGFCNSWDTEHQQQQPSLTLGCKRLRPLAPKFANTITTTTNTTTTASSCSNNSDTSSSVTALDLKSFIRVDHSISPRRLEDKRPDSSHQVESHSGGTRWNPTQEQIGILEMLYKGGMRTPNAQQIEQITAQLSKYGKIEGKNVFYWFQNHKARERQKQKRNSLGLSHSPRTAASPPAGAATIILDITSGEVVEREDENLLYKRKSRSWAMECLEAENNKSYMLYCGTEDQDRRRHNLHQEDEEEREENYKTLELFPLHPEGR